MANYTSTTLKFTETIGDSVIGGNMITSGTLTISPKSGYVVTASDFSISTLPDNVTSVVFTDAGTAGTPSNNVTVTVTFGPLFTVTAGKTINLDIAGDAKLLAAQDTNLGTNTLVVSLDLNKYPNVTTSMAVSDQPTGATFNIGVADNTRIHVLTIQNLIANKSKNIAQIKITASSGYYFNTKPSLSFTRLFEPQAPNLTLKTNSVTRDSKNRITEYVMDVFFISDVQIPHPAAASIQANHTAAFINATVLKAPTITNLIKNVIYGNSEVSFSGQDKVIDVYGDKGATFDLTIIKNSDNSSIISAGNARVFHPLIGFVKGYKKEIYSSLKCSIREKFPAGTDTYTIKIIPTGSTTLSPSLSSEITINQFARPVLNLTTTTVGLTNYTCTTNPTITYTGKANQTIQQLSDFKSIPAKFDFTYVFTRSSSFTFSRSDNPEWSSTVSTSSDWSNSLYTTNGGTHLEMYNLKTSLNGTSTIATVTGSVRIKKFGNASVTMNLDSSQFLTCN